MTARKFWSKIASIQALIREMMQGREKSGAYLSDFVRHDFSDDEGKDAGVDLGMLARSWFLLYVFSIHLLLLLDFYRVSVLFCCHDGNKKTRGKVVRALCDVDDSVESESCRSISSTDWSFNMKLQWLLKRACGEVRESEEVEEENEGEGWRMWKNLMV